MARLKDTTDKIAGKSKQAVAEIIGDGKLREEGKAQQRKGEAEADQPGTGRERRALSQGI